MTTSTPTQAEIDAAAAEAQKKAKDDAQTKKDIDAANAKTAADTARADANTAATNAAAATDAVEAAEENETVAKATDARGSTPETRAAVTAAEKATTDAKAAETTAKDLAATAAAASTAADKKATDAENAAKPPGPAIKPGLRFMTVGCSEKMTVGADLGVTIGQSSKVSVANTVSLTAGITNTVSLGADLNFRLGPKIQWNVSDTYTIDDGSNLSISDTKNEQTMSSYEISSGVNPLVGLAQKQAVDALKRGVKISIGTVSAVNLALASALGVSMVATSGGDGNQNVLDNTDTRNRTANWVAPVGEIAGSTIVTAATFITLSRIMKKLAETIKKLPRVSTLKMDVQGITQKTSFLATTSSLILREDGVHVKSEGGPNESSLSLLANGKVEVNGKESTTIKSPKSVLVGQVGAAGVTTGLSATADEVKLQNTDNSTLKLAAASAKISSTEISILAGTSGFAAKAAETSMVCGQAKVAATATQLDLKAPGSGRVLVNARGVTIVGTLLKFG